MKSLIYFVKKKIKINLHYRTFLLKRNGLVFHACTTLISRASTNKRRACTVEGTYEKSRTF